MPKSSKKKREVSDFTKAKLKLGKGKAQPNNAVDTSFKARSITLPSQSITAAKDSSEPLTKRQLAFRDLLSHFKHHNAGTRRDAILGLKELLVSNWELIDPWMPSLFTALARLIGDEDASVRKQLISFFSWLLPKLSRDDLIPHSSLLLLFATSAQTHIFPEIRIDAIRVLNILLECVPDAVTVGWCEDNEGNGSRILEGYLGILNAGTKYGEADGPIMATAGVRLPPASKSAVLRSLSSFIYVCLSSLESGSSTQNDGHSNKPLDTWFMRYLFPSLEEYHSFDEIFRPESQSRRRSRRIWQGREALSDNVGQDYIQIVPLYESVSGQSWNWNDLSNLKDMFEQESSQSIRTDFVSNLARALHSTLIETFLDCAPSVFPPMSDPSDAELQLVLSVVRIARYLYQYIIQSSHNADSTITERLDSVVGYMATYFPASNNKNNKTEQAFEEYNLSFCTLVSLLFKASNGSHQNFSLKSKATSLTRTDRVSEYIIHRLAGRAYAFPGIAVPVTPAMYTALLPSIFALIKNGGPNPQHKPNEVLHAVLDHALKVSSKSSCKRLTVEFIARILLLDTSLHHLQLSFLSDRVDPSLKPKLETWLLHLVQVLWELGANNILFTEIILRVLLRTLQRRSHVIHPSTITGIIRIGTPKAHSGALISPIVVTSLESRLTPYFFISHPTRGPLMGPFRKLLGLSASLTSGSAANSRLACFLALDVAATLLGLDGSATSKEADALKRAIGWALHEPVAGTENETMVAEIRSYWDHVNLMAK